MLSRLGRTQALAASTTALTRSVSMSLSPETTGHMTSIAEDQIQLAEETTWTTSPPTAIRQLAHAGRRIQSADCCSGMGARTHAGGHRDLP